MSETKNTLKHNILCECDFAQLDRKLKESPQISSIALDGIVCFMNNKTPGYLTSLTEKEKHNLIKWAVTEYSDTKKWNIKWKIALMEEEDKKFLDKLKIKRKEKTTWDTKL